MSEEMPVRWHSTSEMPAKRALLIVETERTTLRKVEFKVKMTEPGEPDKPIWLFYYWHGPHLSDLQVEASTIKRWAYETEESLAELDKFAADMIVDTFRGTIASLERRIAGARHELEKKLPSVTAEVELAIHNALRHLSGEVEREERGR